MLGGKRRGYGTATTSGGGRYEGEFRDGMAHGRGIYAFADGDRMTCEFRNDESVDGTCEFH